MTSVRMSHVGLCVSDWRVPLRFYQEGLGFDLYLAADFGDEAGPGSEVSGSVQVRSQFIVKDGMSVELLWYATPGAVGMPSAAAQSARFDAPVVRG